VSAGADPGTEAGSGRDGRPSQGVLFTGDAKVVQTEIRKREAFLLVDVPCGAALGKTPVVVELDDGSDVLVSGGFTILDATSPGVCDCDN